MGVRFRPRQVQRTMTEHLRDELDARGWFTPGGFKEYTLTLIEYVPERELHGPIVPNTVGVTIGEEGEERLEEMGGLLTSAPIALFVDVYGENQAISLSIASDIMDILRWQRTLVLQDFTTGSAVASNELIELDDIVRERPTDPGDYRKNWNVVKATCRVFYDGAPA